MMNNNIQRDIEWWYSFVKKNALQNRGSHDLAEKLFEIQSRLPASESQGNTMVMIDWDCGYCGKLIPSGQYHDCKKSKKEQAHE